MGFGLDFPASNRQSVGLCYWKLRIIFMNCIVVISDEKIDASFIHQRIKVS